MTGLILPEIDKTTNISHWVLYDKTSQLSPSLFRCQTLQQTRSTCKIPCHVLEFFMFSIRFLCLYNFATNKGILYIRN